MAQFILPNPNQIRGDQLADEINTATGLTLTVFDATFYPPDTVQIEVPAEHIATVQTVINAHVPQAIYTADDQQRVTTQAGRDGLANLPGWATWTADEAEGWIQTNVTDLASAKTALKAMAKAIVYLRNQTMGQ